MTVACTSKQIPRNHSSPEGMCASSSVHEWNLKLTHTQLGNLQSKQMEQLWLYLGRQITNEEERGDVVRQPAPRSWRPSCCRLERKHGPGEREEGTRASREKRGQRSPKGKWPWKTPATARTTFRSGVPAVGRLR